MNAKSLFLFLATGSALMAQPAPTLHLATADVAPAAAPSTSAPGAQPAFAPPAEPATHSPAPTDSTNSPTPAVPPAPDDSAIPSANFAPSRYETLWIKSPFAVETDVASVDTSPDYQLVGLANVDGITFASLIDRKNQEHFLISSDKPTRDLTLSTITKNHDGSETYANVLRAGQTLTLKLEQAAASAPGAPGMPGVPGMPPVTPMAGQPGSITPNIQIPGSAPFGPGSVRPFPRLRRPPIHLPNQNQPQPAIQTPPPPPQAH